MSTIPLENGEEITLLDSTQTVMNENLTVIAAALNELFEDVASLTTKVNAVYKDPTVIGPWLSTIVLPIDNGNGFIPGYSPAITSTFITNGILAGVTAGIRYFLSKIGVSAASGGSFTLYWSAYGAPSSEVASVQITKTQVLTNGQREFALSPIASSGVYGAIRIGDDFVTAINRPLSTVDYTWSIAYTEWSPSCMVVKTDFTEAGETFRSNEIPTGLKNGSNRAFTISRAEEWEIGSLTVYLNGVAYAPDELDSITTTTFEIEASVDTERLPTTGDDFTVSYLVKN